jgi:hypothetical protein
VLHTRRPNETKILDSETIKAKIEDKTTFSLFSDEHSSLRVGGRDVIKIRSK